MRACLLKMRFDQRRAEVLHAAREQRQAVLDRGSSNQRIGRLQPMAQSQRFDQG